MAPDIKHKNVLIEVSLVHFGLFFIQKEICGQIPHRTLVNIWEVVGSHILHLLILRKLSVANYQKVHVMLVLNRN